VLNEVPQLSRHDLARKLRRRSIAANRISASVPFLLTLVRLGLALGTAAFF